jgi:hypothetical protein
MTLSADQLALAQQPPPATSGSSSDFGPGGMSTGPPSGSTADLEGHAAQAQSRLAASLHQAAMQPQQQGWSDENPYGPIAKDYQQKLQDSQPPPVAGGTIKRLLTNFVSGMGSGMMHEAGLPTPEQTRQQMFQNFTTASQLAAGWENQKGELRYRNALSSSLEASTQYQSQLQPLELQHQQLTNQQLQQNQPTVRPSMTAGDLAQLGVPSYLAAQYAGRSLSEADMNSVRQMAAANQKQTYDFGADGTGAGKGIWLVDRQFNPVKQLSPISETSRSTSLARQQMQLQLMQSQSSQVGQDLVEGRLDPSQISPRSPMYPFALQQANAYSQQKYGQPFDFAKAGGDYKYAANTATKNTLTHDSGRLSTTQPECRHDLVRLRPLYPGRSCCDRHSIAYLAAAVIRVECYRNGGDCHRRYGPSGWRGDMRANRR